MVNKAVVSYQPISPFVDMFEDLLSTARPYHNKKEFFKDLGQFFIGLKNVLVGLKDFVVGIFTNRKQAGFGAASVLRGISQIATFPLAWLRLAWRGPMTGLAACFPPKVVVVSLPPISGVPLQAPMEREQGIKLHEQFEKKREEAAMAVLNAKKLKPPFRTITPPPENQMAAASVINVPARSVTPDAELKPLAPNTTKKILDRISPKRKKPTATAEPSGAPQTSIELLKGMKPVDAPTIGPANLIALAAAFPDNHGGVDVEKAASALSAGYEFQRVARRSC